MRKKEHTEQGAGRESLFASLEPGAPNPLRMIVSREQMPAMKEAGWKIIAPYGGGSYVMEAPR